MLGLKRKTVMLVKHNPRWKEAFEKEKKLLLKTFGDTIVAIEHIGSTSITGIVAKPILDMNIGVKSLTTARKMKKKFEDLGYEYRGANGLQEQELYVKGPESKRTHHAHVTIHDSDYWKRDLRFRDYLNTHPKIASQYETLKKSLAKKFSHDRESYTASKADFIKKILQK